MRPSNDVPMKVIETFDTLNSFEERSERKPQKSVRFQGSIAPSMIESKSEFDGATTILEMQSSQNYKADKKMKVLRDQYSEVRLDSIADVMDENSDDYKIDLDPKPKKKRNKKKSKKRNDGSEIWTKKQTGLSQAPVMSAKYIESEVFDGISGIYRSKVTEILPTDFSVFRNFQTKGEDDDGFLDDISIR